MWQDQYLSKQNAKMRKAILFFSPFTVVRATQIFGILKKQRERSSYTIFHLK